MLNLRFLTLAVCGLSLCLGPLPAQDKPAEAKPAEKSPNDLFAELDKNKDGTLTADEVAEDKKRFFEHAVRVGDKNKDGKLTADEFAEGVKPEEPRPATAERDRPGDRPRQNFNPEENFQRMDVNKDGKLTVSEVPERAQEFLARLLERAGKAKDGELTKDEYLKTVREMGRPGGFQGNDPAETFAQFDRNKDDKLTLEEIPERTRDFFARLWERAGKSRDEAFTKEEFVRVARTAMGAQGGENPEALFKRLDTNGDGKVTLEENDDRTRRQLANLFRLAGKEPDGELTLEEFKTLRTQNPGVFGIPGGQPSVGFGKLDANNDGRISKEELAQAAAKFDELDENKDGQLDPRELAPARGENRRPEGGPGNRRPDGDRRGTQRKRD